jgi:hypothetical protein
VAHQSSPLFCTFHALRIKGFAKPDVLAELGNQPIATVEAHLAELQSKELAMFREARGLWQLTPAGRAAHGEALQADLAGFDAAAALGERYHEFLHQNEAFKLLCGDWQLRDGSPNDHSDAAYDRAVVDRLVALDAVARPIVAAMGQEIARIAVYEERLERTCEKVVAGDPKMFTGVMCGSYHDVWMELHEDLILTQGIDRTAEGSF